MKKIETGLLDCYIIEPDKFGDERGYYSPFFTEKDNLKNELGNSMRGVVQGARSLSGKGIVRGLHFQKDPYCQAKLVECLSGGVLDVVVDMRKDSPTYKQWISVELTPEKNAPYMVKLSIAELLGRGILNIIKDQPVSDLFTYDRYSQHDDKRKKVNE